MSSLTACLKRVGSDISAEDKALVIRRSRELRATGLSPTEAAKKAARSLIEEIRATMPPEPAQAMPAAAPAAPAPEPVKVYKTKGAATLAKKAAGNTMRLKKVDGGYILREATDTELAAAEKAGKRLAGAKAVNVESDSILTAIAKLGGLSLDERSDTIGEGNKNIGGKMLFTKNGKAIDDLAAGALRELGYVPQSAVDDDGGVRWLRDAIKAEFMGTATFNSEQGTDWLEEAQRAYEDAMTASEDILADFTPDDLDASGYTAADPKVKAAAEAILAEAESLGIDTEMAREDAAKQTQDQTEDDYYEALKGIVGQAIAQTRQRAQGSEQGAGEAGAGDRGQAQGGEGAQEGLSERFAAGKALTKQQRKQVLETLVDAYKAKGAPRELKGIGRDGNERYGYVHSPELFEKSDITGAMVRYYVTLPDGRRAHPSELFPDYTQSDIETAVAAQEAAEKQDQQNQASAVSQAERFAQDTPEASEAAWRARNRGPNALSDWKTGKPRALVNMAKDGKFYSVREDDEALMRRLERAGWSRGDDFLSAQTPDDLKARAEREKAAEAADRAEQKRLGEKAAADAARDEFVLTGSDRAADVAAAAGQADIFDQPAESAPAKIDDIGEKIGGARKDVAVGGGTRSKRGNSGDNRPAWARRFQVSQIVRAPGQINAMRDEGRWIIRDTRSLDWMKQAKQVGRLTFATQEEAEAYVPIAAVSLKHRAVPTRGDKYEIWRDITDRKRVKVVDREFDTRDEAMAYMAANAAAIIETNTTFGEADMPLPPDRARTGPERRTGNVAGEDFKTTFGFRGVEFGNWNNQEERQALMNDAWDGLLDLADVLGIPPKAIGLNGDLALAFGARGHGLNSARAHYELDRAVINLTKERGAGSLAHEWFHALDHYFGRQDGKASATWDVQPDGTRTLKVAGDGADMASSGFRRDRSGVRPEVREAYTALLNTMFKKAESYVEDTAKVDKFTGTAREDLARELDKLRQDWSEQKDVRYWKRNNAPASAEVLAEFDTIAAKMLAGELLETDWRTFASGTEKRARLSTRWTNDAMERLSELNKQVRGRSGFDAEGKGVLDRLRGSMNRYSQRLKMLADAQSGTEKTKMVPTEFAMNAKELDQGRGGDYWTTPHEMAARAFQGYVEDKVAERGGVSRFLNYGPENAGILTPWGFKRPFPVGAERKAINKALDAFVGTLQTRTDDAGNIALLSRRVSTAYDQAFRRAVRGEATADDLRTIRSRSGYGDLAETALARDVDAASALRGELESAFGAWGGPFLDGQRGAIATNAGWLRSASDQDLKRLTDAADRFDAPVIVRGQAKQDDKAFVERMRAAGFQPHTGMFENRSRHTADVTISMVRPGGGITATTPLASRSIGRGVPFTDLERTVSKITAEWGPQAPAVDLYRSVDELPKNLYNALESQNALGEVRAFYVPGGRIAIIADRLDNMDEAVKAIGHEAYGHAGMRLFLGDRYQTQMALLRLANPKLAAEANKWYAANGADEIAARVERGMSQNAAAAEVRALAVEEALSDRAGDMPPPNGWKSIMAALQKALRNFPSLKAFADWLESKTEAETYALLMAARRAIKRGAKAGRVVPDGALAMFSRRFSSLPGHRPTASYVDATPRQQATLDAIDAGPESTDYDLIPAKEDINRAADASFEDWELERGIKYVPIGMLGPLTGYDTAKDVARIRKLADAIKSSNSFEPIFVGIDPSGEAYVIEGQHRTRALELLGDTHVPARVIVDMTGSEADYAARPDEQIRPPSDYRAVPGQVPLFKRDPPPVETQTNEGRPVYRGQGLILDFPLPTERIEIIPEPGQEVLNYPIMPEGSFESLGYVELLVENGKPISLLDIEINREGRAQGIGRRVIETLLAANPEADLNISNIVEDARGFWARMGVPEQNRAAGEAYDGTLNWQTYAQAQAENPPGTSRAGQAGRRAGGRADAAAEGRVPGSVGQAPLLSRQPKRDPVTESALRKAGVRGPRKLNEKVRAYLGRALDTVRDRKRFANAFQQGALDQFHGINEAIRNELGGLPSDQDPYITARLANGGTSSVMRALLLHGQAKWANNGQHLEKIDGTKGLLDILRPLGDDLNDWFGWMVGNRAARLFKEGRENNLSEDEIKALQALADTPEKRKAFIAASMQYAAFKRSVLDVAEEAGLIDKEARKAWDHADYIPFYREIDDKALFSATGKKGLAGQSSGIRVLRGGESDLNDPMENLLMNFSRLIDASLKNNAIDKTIAVLEAADSDLVKKVGYDMKGAIVPRAQVRKMLIDAGTPESIVDTLPPDVFDGMAKMWAIQAPTDPSVVRVMRGGKPQFYKVDDPLLLSALTSFVPFDFPGLALMRAAKRLLTATVTATPEFMARNFIRDSVASQAITKSGFNPLESLAGIRRSYKELGGYEAMLFAGASFQSGNVNAGSPESTAVHMRRALRERGMDASSVESFMGSLIDYGAAGWEKYRQIGEAIENANREAVYEAALKSGKSATQAAFESKDLMDFSLRGSWAGYQILADVLPFFNARVQGLYRLGRSDPKRMAAVGTLMLVATLALALANAGEDWYEELEDWDKDGYWHFKVGGKHFRLPKPFEVGVIFATVPERIARNVMGLDTGKKTLGRVWANVRDQLAFDPMPQLFRPAVDAWANKDSFRDRAIENQGDEGKPVHARYDVRTSDTMRLIADKAAPVTDAVGLSPKKLEFLLNGYFGTAGMYALALSDYAVRAGNDRPVRPELRTDDLPLVRAFYRMDPARSTIFTSEVYKMHREIEEIVREYNALRKSANPEDQAKAEELRTKNDAKFAARKPLAKATRQLAKINRDMADIYNRRDMTAKEKRERIDALQIEKNAIAKDIGSDKQLTSAF